MEELISQIATIARGMWRFRWPALVVAWIVGIVGAVVAFQVPDQYSASARIYVDTQSILKPLMSGLAVQPNVEQQIAMLSRTLISRPNIEKLIRMADLDLKSDSKGKQEALVDSLMRSVSIRAAGRDNLYSLSYADSDKEKAKRVIQSMVSIFVESSLGASRKGTDSAKVFLDEQIRTYEAKLEEAETRLKEFRLRNIDMQLAEGKDSAARLGEIGRLLEAAKLELKEAENARDSVKKQIEVERAQPGGGVVQSLLQESAMAQVATPEIDARIAAQKRNLDALLQRFTEQHPDIVNARRMIKDLEEQRREEITQLRKAALANPQQQQAAQATLAMQELTKLLATYEVQVAALRARVSEYQGRYANALASTKTSPQIEAEATQLNRDYGIVKKNYEALVSRRQSAQMSGELDMAASVADFRLIDPPRVSPRPVSPNRLNLLLMALGAAIGAGLAAAFAASQLRPVYMDARELRAKTALPLLGVVSIRLTDDERQKERMSMLRFYSGVGGLLASYMVAMVTVSIIAARQVA